MEQLHILISGLVQGVFFRQSTQNYAKKHLIKGFVRNLDDGRVEALFQADEKTLKKALIWCKKGPENARVYGVDVVWSEKTKDYDSFSIRY